MKSSVWKDTVIFTVWCWCLLKATHDTHKFPFNGTDFEVKAGQFVTGIKQAISELPKITPRQYRTAMTYLKSTDRLTVKSNNKFSLVSIVKWEEYQKDDSQDDKRTTSKRQASDKQTTTYKNDKNDKNDKEIRMPTPAEDGDRVQELLEERGGIQHDYQYLGLEIYEKLKAPPNKKAECIRIARDYGEFTQRCLSFALDYPNPALKWKMFLWKLSELRKKDVQANTTKPENRIPDRRNPVETS